MQIIGVAGMPGSGVAEFARALAVRRRWTLVSLPGLLENEARSRGLAGSSEECEEIRREWRAVEGEGVLIEHAVARYRQSPDLSGRLGLLVYGLWCEAEVDAIRRLVGRLIWVDAEPEVRAARLGVEDVDSIAQIPEELMDVAKRCDLFYENNGTDLTKLRDDAAHMLDHDSCCAIEFD